MNKNSIYTKSFEFSVRIVNVYKYLCKEHKEFVMSKQLLRSGTSTGANVHEAIAAQSKADFVSKMSIAAKEARETNYWIQLLIATNYLKNNEGYVQSLQDEIEEIIKILTSIVKTTQENLRKQNNAQKTTQNS